MGPKSRFPLAHRLPSKERQLSQTSGTLVPRWTRGALAGGTGKSKCGICHVDEASLSRYQLHFHRPSQHHRVKATGNGGTGEEARTGEKVHGHAQFCVGLGEHTKEFCRVLFSSAVCSSRPTQNCEVGKSKGKRGGQGGAMGPVRPARRGNSAGASSL